MQAPCFLTSVPVSFLPSGASKSSTSPLRPLVTASASLPDSSPDDENLNASRGSLEKLLNLDLTPSSSKSGQCPCIWCSGTKQRKCTWCVGKGYREEIVNKTWEDLTKDIEKMQKMESMGEVEKVPVVCKACSGSKLLRCIYCRGSGIGSYGHSY